MKKFFSLMMVGIISLVMVSCDTAEDNQNKVVKQKPLVVVITDVGGIGDHSFNDAALEALEDVQKEENIDIRCLEAESANDYAKVLQESINSDAAITIAVGSNMKAAIEKVAKANPDKLFGIVDATTELENVQDINFADNESGFLAGYAAAKTSKTGRIGLLGGDDRATVSLFRYGYIAGAKSANPDVEVVTDYIGSFYDADKGYDATIKMYDKYKTDVIMHVAGPSGIGVIKAAEEKGIWAIGADMDQSHLSSKHVLCSAVKDMEPAMEDMVKMTLKDKFKKEVKIYNMEEESVYLSDNAGNIKGDLKEKLEELKDDIESGKIKVPNSEESLNNYEFLTD